MQMTAKPHLYMTVYTVLLSNIYLQGSTCSGQQNYDAKYHYNKDPYQPPLASRDDSEGGPLAKELGLPFDNG